MRQYYYYLPVDIFIIHLFGYFPICFRDINLSDYLYGDNIKLVDENRTAVRIKSFTGGILICDNKLLPNELFQVLIVKCNTNYAGSLRIGLVTGLPETPLPSSINDLNVNRDVWFFSGIVL